jgi:hypothetical protein
MQQQIEASVQQNYSRKTRQKMAEKSKVARLPFFPFYSDILTAIKQHLHQFINGLEHGRTQMANRRL